LAHVSLLPIAISAQIQCTFSYKNLLKQHHRKNKRMKKISRKPMPKTRQ
jgi:hypothetical protein